MNLSRLRVSGRAYTCVRALPLASRACVSCRAIVPRRRVRVVSHRRLALSHHSIICGDTDAARDRRARDRRARELRRAREPRCEAGYFRAGRQAGRVKCFTLLEFQAEFRGIPLLNGTKKTQQTRGRKASTSSYSTIKAGYALPFLSVSLLLPSSFLPPVRTPASQGPTSPSSAPPR